MPGVKKTPNVYLEWDPCAQKTKEKTQPTICTVSKSLINNDLETINLQEAAAVTTFMASDNENTNSNRNTLLDDFKLQPFDTDDDNFLLDYLRQNPIKEYNVTM